MGTCASRTVGAPVSHQKARISFDLHGCVTWMSTPCTALEPLDRSSQPARSVVLNDPRLQLDRVEHRSLAGCSMHNLGSGQRVAARARWWGRASRRTSANGVCCSGGSTMCCAESVRTRARVEGVCVRMRARGETLWSGRLTLPTRQVGAQEKISSSTFCLSGELIPTEWPKNLCYRQNGVAGSPFVHDSIIICKISSL